MKKVLALLITLLFFVGCSSKTYTALTYDQFKTKISNQDSFVLVISRTGCSHCDNYKKTINRIVSKYGIDIYFIDMADLTDEEINEFKSTIKWDYSTPVTVFIKGGLETTTYDRIIGDYEYSVVVKKLQDLNYIE